MVTTITDSITTIALSPMARSLTAMLTAAVVGLLILKEIVREAERPGWQRVNDGLTVILLPLGIGVVIIVLAELTTRF